jgi:hypothetical protein
MDYTVGMQIVDGETVHFQFNDAAKPDITLIPMDLHRGGEALYAVIVPNSHKSKQKWKVIDCGKGDDGQLKIEEAFMTKEELEAKFGIFGRDLPRGSRAKHDNWEQELAAIEVNSKLIRATNWSHIRIVQSKQNCAKSGMVSGRNRKRKGNGKAGQRALCGNKICSRRFEQFAVDSLEKLRSEGTELTPIAHFKFRRNEYHLEKLLPVHIPGEGLVAVSFWFNPATNRVQASGVCLDLTDIRNKANLVRSAVDHESWIKALGGDDSATINNLVIEECEKQCDHRGQSALPRSKNQRRREKNKRKTKAPRHNGPRNAAKTPSPPPSSTASVVSSDSSPSTPNSAFSGLSGFSEISGISGVSGCSSISGHSAPRDRAQFGRSGHSGHSGNSGRSVPRGQDPVWTPPAMAQHQAVGVQRAVHGDYGWFHQQGVAPMMAQTHYGGGAMNGGGGAMMQQPMYHGQGQGHGHYQQQQQPQQQQQHGHYGHNGWYQQPQGGYPLNGGRY